MTGETGYAQRAGYYAAEISSVPVPALLAGLLRPGLAVAEMPSGTGHFLAAYSAAGADVTLVDACPQMIEAAHAHATRCGAGATTVCGMIEDLPGRAGRLFDLIVIPNGALNQLAAAAPAARLLAAAARLLAPGGLLLAQILDPGAACGFYDPALADGHWHQDRQFPGDDGRPVTRRRRQHHRGDIVTIDFEMSSGGHRVHRQRATLRLLDTEDLHADLARAGLRGMQVGPGPGGLTEILCALPGQGPQ